MNPTAESKPSVAPTTLGLVNVRIRRSWFSIIWSLMITTMAVTLVPKLGNSIVRVPPTKSPMEIDMMSLWCHALSLLCYYNLVGPSTAEPILTGYNIRKEACYLHVQCCEIIMHGERYCKVSIFCWRQVKIQVPYSFYSNSSIYSPSDTLERIIYITGLHGTISTHNSKD